MYQIFNGFKINEKFNGNCQFPMLCATKKKEEKSNNRSSFFFFNKIPFMKIFVFLIRKNVKKARICAKTEKLQYFAQEKKKKQLALRASFFVLYTIYT